MRFLFLGDIVGTPGLTAVTTLLPNVKKSHDIDFVIANAENVNNGSGLLPREFRKLRSAGVDAVTMGDHIYKKIEIKEILYNPSEPVCKPANYPAEAPGRDHTIIQVHGTQILIVSLQGRTFMRSVDCPFAAIDRVLAKVSAKVIIVDFHAETTADKYQMIHYLDGRVTAVLGTHTHVTTADEQIFPKGTAFQCDVGMTGPHSGVIGRRAEPILQVARTFEPSSFDVATEDVRLVGTVVDLNSESGLATHIKRLQVNLPGR